MSQVTCGDHVKWITDERSRKDRSVSKGETMSIEKDSDLKRRVRIGDIRKIHSLYSSFFMVTLVV